MAKKKRARSPAAKGRAKKTTKRRSKGKKAPAAARAKRTTTPRARKESAEVRRLRELAELMREHELVELELGPGKTLKMSKVGGTAPAPVAYASPLPAAAPSAAPSPQTATEAAAEPADSDVTHFPSPMVGTFYRAASPEAAPYAVPGDKVNPDSTLCIIEAMKVFNEIKAETSGTIVDILVENGEAVEYGQPLFAIRK